MTVIKCSAMGCSNPVPQMENECTECQTSKVGGGRYAE